MNKKELSVIALIVLFLLPVASQAFTVEKSLVPGEIYAVYGNAEAGWRIEGSFVTTNDIEFFICNESNYTAWKLHETSVRYNYRNTTLGEEFNFTVPYESVWYVVFSDFEARGVDGIEIEVNYIDQLNTTHTQVSWASYTPEVDYLLIGLVGVTAVIGILVVFFVLQKVRR
ncbi:MAG: hypothetical protein ACFFFK_11780 [Candidatus Thorarchaeota archaeon]